jgi:uncharacterized protein (DUF58 family)
MLALVDGVAVLYVLYQGGQTAPLILLFLGILTLFWISHFFSGIRRIRGERQLSHGHALRHGTRLGVKMHYRIPGFGPIPYVTVQDDLQLTTHKNMLGLPVTLHFEQAFVPQKGRRGDVFYQTPPLTRGAYSFGETCCTTRDVFGFFAYRGKLRMPASFCVYPETIAIEQWHLYQETLLGDVATTHVQRKTKDSTQINGVREYVVGDKLSRIHWAATARTGSWKSKEYEQESDPRTCIVFDQHPASYDSQQQFELALSVVASLAQYVAQQKVDLSVIYADHQHKRMVPETPQQNEQLLHVLNQLACMNMDAAISLVNIAKYATEKLSDGSYVIVVTGRGGVEAVKAMQCLADDRLICELIHVTAYADAGSAYDVYGTEWLRTLRKTGISVHQLGQLSELPRKLARASQEVARG